MESNSENKLTIKDIDKMSLRSAYLQSAFNYTRMQGNGWAHSVIPTLKKIYKDDEEGFKEAMKDHSTFINTAPPIVSFLMGLLMSLEENKENRVLINSIKVALFGPLAGIGDAIFWFTLLPIVAGISASFAMQGNIIGPIIMFVVYIGLFFARIPMGRLGYKMGSKSISKLKSVSKYITESATILGVTVIGGLVASYIHITVLTKIPVADGHFIGLQEDFFDKIFPNLLPLGYTFLMLYLIKKKISPVILIVLTFAGAILGSLLGVL